MPDVPSVHTHLRKVSNVFFLDSDQDTDSDVQDLECEFRSRLNSKGHNKASITDKLHEELTKAKEVNIVLGQ